MSTLSQLKLVTAVKPQHMPEIVKRRYKLSNKLWEQIQLAKSLFLNQPFDLKKSKRLRTLRRVKQKQLACLKRCALGGLTLRMARFAFRFGMAQK